MHVLIIPSWFDSNEPYRISPFIFEQALALHHSDVDVGILHVGFSGWGITYRNQDLEGIRTISVTLPRVMRRMRQLSLTLLFRAYEILYWRYSHLYGDPVLLHAHSMYAGGICAAQLSQRHKCPFVITEHFSGYSLGTFKSWQLKAIRNAANYASGIYFVSNALREDFAKRLPIKNASVIPNNYSDKLYENIVPFVPFNQRKYFCIVARLDSNKNVELCLRAFALLAEKNNDLVVIGAGVEQKKLEKIADDLDIAERVIFFGSQSRDDTFAIVKGAIALVVSSNYETFGMTILEAAILGTPVISTKCGGPVEILGDNFGMLVEKKDIKGLAEAMQSASADKGVFKCSDAARIVSSLYSPSKIASQLKAAYHTVINRRMKNL